MAEFTLVIGNKNYSSWSLRGWLMARIAGIEFEEILIPLDLPETQAAIRKHSPSGRVPVLLHRGLAVWESLAIAEYLNDLKPEAGLWPAAAAARAHARSISTRDACGLRRAAEQHADEHPRLVSRQGHDARRCAPTSSASPACGATAASASRRPSHKDDGFLFGTFGAADAMYAPVVTRLRTYGVKLDTDTDAYCTAVMNHPAMKDWIDAAKHEPWLIAEAELSRFASTN